MADYTDDYPAANSGEWFMQPEGQTAAGIDEADKLAKAAPLIQEVVAHLQEQVRFLDSIDSIPVDFTLDPEMHQKLMEINRAVKDKLQDEVNYLTNIVTAH